MHVQDTVITKQMCYAILHINPSSCNTGRATISHCIVTAKFLSIYKETRGLIRTDDVLNIHRMHVCLPANGSSTFNNVEGYGISTNILYHKRSIDAQMLVKGLTSYKQ